MKDMSYDRFVQILEKKSWEDLIYEEYLDVLAEIINHDKVKYFYPKNLFIEDKPLTVYFFTDKSVTIVKIMMIGNIKVQTYNYNTIKDVSLEYNGKYNPVKMTITLNDKSDFVLYPKEDTTEGWYIRYSTHLKNIYDLFI